MTNDTISNANTATDAPEAISDEALNTVDGGYLTYKLENVMAPSHGTHGNSDSASIPGDQFKGGADKLGNFEIQDLMSRQK